MTVSTEVGTISHLDSFSCRIAEWSSCNIGLFINPLYFNKYTISQYLKERLPFYSIFVLCILFSLLLHLLNHRKLETDAELYLFVIYVLSFCE